MPDGVKLLHELKSGSYQAAVFGSYNVSFPFFEQVVLRTLRSHGCDHNLLLMDAKQCAANIVDAELAPRSAGRLYGVVPVAASGAFHPKFMLLVGRHQSKLLVGSHNLTLSGFGLNREISNLVNVNDPASEAVVQAVFQFALEWARTCAAEMADLVESTGNWAPWLRLKREADGAVTVLSTLPSGPSLWDQLRERIAPTVARVTVIGPYFDEQLRFLTTLREAFPDASINVGVAPQHSEINASLASRPSGITFKDLSRWTGDTQDQLVHAKIVHFEYPSGESVLVSGSANPSAPAWLDSEHRNAELVLVRLLKKNTDVVADLGLLDVAKCPNMNDAAWAVVRERRKCEHAAIETSSRTWLAIEQDRGFVVDESFAEEGDDIDVFDHEGDVLAQVKASPSSGGRHYVAVDDDDIRGVATRLRIQRGASVTIALVQHLQELRDRATSEKHRTLRQALLDLDTKEEGIDSYLAVIEKAIFDEEPVPREPAARSSAASRTATADTGFIGIGDLRHKGGRKHRLSTGDIGLVLDALIHKLGEGLPAGPASPAKMSEEEIDDDTDIPCAEGTVDDGRRLAQCCRRKTRTLMKRMLGRLTLAWNEEARPFAVVVQLVACLALLHRLQQRQRSFSWLPRGENLIELDWHWKLVKEAPVVVFAPETGVAGGLLEQHGQFSELLSAAALILWSAWVTGLDINTALGRRSPFDADEEDPEEQRQNLIGLGLLLNCLNRDLLPPTAELELLFSEDGLAWIETHLAWAEEVMTAPPRPGPIVPGSVVQFRRGQELDVGVVVDAAEGKVEVVDRTTGETVVFSADWVRWVGALPPKSSSILASNSRAWPC